jgi:hypothetical protein
LDKIHAGVLTCHGCTEYNSKSWTLQDLSLSWAGKLPLPEFARGGRAPKRSTLAADLVDLWNSSFFLARGVEVVLYKGRERRSGPNAGVIDKHLSTYDADDSDSDSSTDSSDSDDSDDSDDGRSRGGYGGEYGLYGRQAGQMPDYNEARRKRWERKMEKKRRHKEKKMRKKAKARENTYALYLTYAPGRAGPAMGGGMGM